MQLASGEWVEFVENGQNRLMSTPGESGYCPPPNSDKWLPGLIGNAWCVQLHIEDGGVNDIDGQANGVIVAPGRVSQ